jgi:uncharacterized protein YegJ (DUF2314 family)
MTDTYLSVESDDPKMAAAIREAQATLRTFFDAFVRPKSNQTAFLLKARFEHDGDVEHIWLADIDASVSPLQGTVANEPRLPTLKFMEPATFTPADITDWMYIQDGYLVGGYTTRAIRDALSPTERAAYDAQAPYKFDKPSLLGRVFGKRNS